MGDELRSTKCHNPMQKQIQKPSKKYFVCDLQDGQRTTEGFVIALGTLLKYIHSWTNTTKIII